MTGLLRLALGYRIILAALVLLGLPVVTVAAATARLFVWPETDEPRQADAVVVLSGDYGDRIEGGLALMRRGVAPTLVLDGQPDAKAVADLCTARLAFQVVCLRPEPDSTRAEAVAVGRLVAERGWQRVVVVTSASHVTRAGLLFRRCTGRPVDMVGTTPPYGLRTKAEAIVHEWLGLTEAMVLRRSC